MMESERVVVQAPMSFVGSARRIWMVTQRNDGWTAPLTLVALVVIPLVWTVIVGWYVVFGFFVVPWRLLRRGQRKRRQQALRHSEVINAITTQCWQYRAGMPPQYGQVPPPPVQHPLPPPPPVLPPSRPPEYF